LALVCHLEEGLEHQLRYVEHKHLGQADLLLCQVIHRGSD
jgi:hypothetical protein